VIIRWRDGVALGDRNAVADIYRLSERTVRRHCTPVGYDQQTRRALYDVLACEEDLAEVMPRPERSAEAQARRRLFLNQRRPR
jgi:hypothetical protein